MFDLKDGKARRLVVELYINGETFVPGALINEFWYAMADSAIIDIDECKIRRGGFGTTVSIP